MKVNKERMLNTFFDLVRITCHSGDEREMAEFLKKKLADLGATEIVEDDAGAKFGGNTGNIIATFAATANAPTIGLTAHMDCVEPCAGIEPQLKDGIITAAGETILGGDDKAGVAAILEALQIVKENNVPHGKLVVIFCVAEEIGLCGSRHIDTSLLTGIDYIYNLDMGDAPGGIIYRAPGQYTFRVTMRGRSAHAGAEPEKGINAIQMMASALTNIPAGRIDAETTANVGMIEGGIATNIVAEECRVDAEIRSLDEEKLEMLKDRTVAAFKEVEKKFPGGKAEIEVYKEYDSFTLDTESEIMQLPARAARALGLEVKFLTTGGGCDAHMFNRHGIPTAALSTGMAEVHTVNEYLEEAHLYQTGAWLYKIIETSTE